MELYIFGILLGMIVMGLIGAAVSSKHTQSTGFILGFLLGPLGIILAAIIGNRPAPQQARHAPASGMKITVNNSGNQRIRLDENDPDVAAYMKWKKDHEG